MDSFVYTLPSDPLARPLIEDLARDYDERYGLNDGIPSSFELQRYPAELFGPGTGGAFVLLIRDGEAIAGGAFKRTSPSVAEAKRVWTHPQFRRQGLGRLVMRELEREAAARGYTSMELTTGARQPEALGLYRTLGYTPLFDLEADYEEIGYLGFSKDLAAVSGDVAATG